MPHYYTVRVDDRGEARRADPRLLSRFDCMSDSWCVCAQGEHGCSGSERIRDAHCMDSCLQVMLIRLRGVGGTATAAARHESRSDGWTC
jgi:hypothetical protein